MVVSKGFLRSAQLRKLCAALAVALVCEGASAQTPAPVRSSVPDTIAERVAPCMTCHGAQGRATSGGYFPRIAGKPQGYLFNQLVNFREGQRRNATMNYLVATLPDAYLFEIAGYFAAQNPPYPLPQPVAESATVLERGRVLAGAGDAGKKLPACAACHGSALTGVAPAVPGLIGLPRDYVNSQLGAWKNGERKAQAPDCMARIAKDLSAEDLGAISAYLAAQTPPDHAAPAAAASAPPPLECGSINGRSRP